MSGKDFARSLVGAGAAGGPADAQARRDVPQSGLGSIRCPK
jgi:hypothetical protein